MDIATFAGLTLAWGALVIAFMLEGGKPSDLFLASPMLLVVGGTLGATCITVSLREMLKLPLYIKLGLFGESPDPAQYVVLITRYARIARKDGVLGLEKQANDLGNPFLRKGLELIVDGTPSEMVRDILETDIAAMMQRHRVGSEMLGAAGGYAPTMGIIGTVMGLIHMLKSLSEPGKMGPAIAAAFLATLYGVMLANLLFLPLSNKLKLRSQQEAAVHEMIIEGIIAIQSGDNPRIVEMKMLAFLPPDIRNTLTSETGDKNGFDYRRAA